MNILTILTLVAAALMTVAFVPFAWAVRHATGPDGAGAAIGLVFLSILRAGAMIAGFLMVAAQGRLDSVISSRALQVGAIIVGVIIVEVVSCSMFFLFMDYEIQAAMQIAFACLGVLLPVCLLASGFIATRPLFVTAIAGSALLGLAALSGYGALTAEYRTNRAREIQEHDDREARNKAGLAALPEDAPVAAILPYVYPLEPHDTSYWTALARIDKTPDATRQLTQLLQTDQKLAALFVLGRKDHIPPEEAQEECWAAIGFIAKEFMQRMDTGKLPSMVEVAQIAVPMENIAAKNEALRARHSTEMIAARNAIYLAGQRGVWYGNGAEWADRFIDPKDRIENRK